MKLRYFWIVAVCLIVLFGTGCKNKCSDKKEDDLIKELLKDEEGATEFRVYFNYQDGSDYYVTNVKLNKLAVKPDKPIRNGYKFIGWYEDKNGVTPFNFSTPTLTSKNFFIICYSSISS